MDRRLSPAKKIVAGLLLLLALALQDTVMPQLALHYVSPDLLLYFVVFPALYLAPQQALWLGAGVGLLEDLLSGKYIGLNVVAKLVAGVLAAQFGARFYKENIITPFFAMLLAAFGAGLTYFFLAQLTPLQLPFFASLWRQVLPEAFYTALLAPPLYLFVYLFFIQGGRRRNGKL